MKPEIESIKSIEILKKYYKIENITIKNDLFLTPLLDENGICINDILIENCTFNNNFGAPTGILHGRLSIKNCETKGDFILFGIFTHKVITIDNCLCRGNSQLCGGGFYNGIILTNNVFEQFVDFGDQDIRGQATIINNQFKAGTNLMHPKGGPSGAHFDVPPYLEGNTGLDQYERPQ